MTFDFPEGLAPEVYPLAWLVGDWQGSGEITYPGIPRTEARQRLSFTHDGGPYLAYQSTLSVTGEDGQEGPVWAAESGFWRVSPRVPDGVRLQEGQHPVEVVLTDASGFVAVYLGAVGNGRVDLATDIMARTASAPEVGGATRMYGLVAGELMWAWDLAAFGHELQSYAALRLSRVEG